MKEKQKNNFSKFYNAGFTLLEVIIALTLLSMMMISVYNMISSSIQTKDRIIKDDRETLALEFALYRIEQDISQIYSPLFHSGLQAINSSLYEESNSPAGGIASQNNLDAQNSFVPTPKYPAVTGNGEPIPSIDAESDNSISFFSTANRRKVQDAKQSRYAWIKYSLRSTEKTDEVRLIQEDTGVERGEYEIIRQVHAQDIYSPEHQFDKIRPQVLLKSVKEMDFLYWNAETKKFATSPKELAGNKNSLRMIKLKLTYINNDGNEMEIERIYRVGWPFFNPQKDIDAIKASRVTDGPISGESGGTGDADFN